VVALGDHVIHRELDIAERCVRGFEVGFLAFGTHAGAEKFIDDGRVLVVPTLVEVPIGQGLVLISRHR
jgi:hypothetical protein